MIFDSIENASAYKNLHKGIAMALEAEAAYTPENYELGTVELDGDHVFLIRNAYQTRSVSDAQLEAHRTYIDVMYMVEGEEIIYVKPTNRLSKITMEYDPEQDVLFGAMDEDTTAVHLTPGTFVVLFPQDAHAPACMVKESKSVKKIIAKVRL